MQNWGAGSAANSSFWINQLLDQSACENTSMCEGEKERVWLEVLHNCVSKNIENNVLKISTVRLILRGTKPQPRHNKRHKPIRFVERSRHLVTVHDKLNDPDFF